jgi:hypothetical protein
MADIRIKDLATTASVTASDDFMAVDGTTSGTRKLSAATPSFATSVTVPGVSGPTSTDLTLAGGSTGASLVLGQGASGVATLKSLGTGRTVISSALGATTPTAAVFNDTLNTRTTFGIIGNGGSSQTMLQFGYGLVAAPTNTGSIFVSASDFVLSTAGSLSFGLAGGAEWARFATSTGNLLIGGTTDITGSGGLKVFGTTAASSTTSGALQVAGGLGVAGAGYFGGTVTITTTGSSGLVVNNTSGNPLAVFNASAADAGVTNNAYITIQTASTPRWYLGQSISAADGAFEIYGAAQAAASLKIAKTTGNTSVASTTEATTSAGVGALTTAGGIHAAKRIVSDSTEASTSSTTGAGIFAGGIYAGAASYFGGAVTAALSGGQAYVNVGGSPVSLPASYSIVTIAAGNGAVTEYQRTNATARTWRTGVGINGADEFAIHDVTAGGSIAFSIAGATKAATFAGAVTIAGTVIHTLSATPASASATGTVGTMSWDASYIYICTATNTWKRVAIATW